jgi:hypothetical protein
MPVLCIGNPIYGSHIDTTGIQNKSYRFLKQELAQIQNIINVEVKPGKVKRRKIG